ncbi:monocarboxylate transporter [Pseudozyma hubeiensis SY62]|uniref:Monocarboxylate transporter n=1 Tax=Pseudozyma hubeiensis (strain SY62) TaxID=1305764 RepID=R9P8L0_PSEHS|nr:monocarboxylate transporter [Pseudozyma hubeiensis SY62]GAC94410.1 monocarboxylate transporter [Pseudozyma hubeiensis SY62]
MEPVELVGLAQDSGKPLHHHELQPTSSSPAETIRTIRQEPSTSSDVEKGTLDHPGSSDGQPTSISALTEHATSAQHATAVPTLVNTQSSDKESCTGSRSASNEDRPSGNDSTAPIKDRGWQAWKFVLASAATEFMIWGASWGYGSFQEYHQQNPQSPFHHASLTATSSVGTTLLAGQHFVTLLTFGLYTMFPPLVKTFTYICVVGSSLSLLIASFSHSIALLILFQGLVYGMFSGNVFLAVILWLPNWWDERRGFATSIMFSGAGIGGIVWPIIFSQTLQRIGFRGTLRLWALLQLIISGGAVMCLKPGRKPPPTPKPLRWKSALPGFPRSLLSPVALLNIVVSLTQSTAYYSISLNISNYASSVGFSSTTSTAILSAFNASAAITYFVLSYLVDRFAYPLLMATSTTLNLVFTVLVLGFAGRSLTKIIVYVVFFGLTGGGFACFMTPMARDIPDRSRSHEFSLRFLYYITFRGLAAMVGPIIAVQVYPKHLGRESTYGSFGFTSFIAFISGTLALSTCASLAIFAHKRYLQPKQDRVKVLSNPVTPPAEARQQSGTVAA